MAMIKTQTNNKEKWCYTTEVPGDLKVPEEFGTHTWGWVQLTAAGATGKYVIKVFSATSSYGEIQSSFSVKMLGDMGISDALGITDHGFNRGEITEVDKTVEVVGDIVMLQVTVGGAKP